MIRISYITLTLMLLLPLSVQSSEKVSQSEQVLNQELLLNQLITSIHTLQLDFLDTSVREILQEQLVQLDENFQQWPSEVNDPENSDLLITVKSLWPAINRHILWLTKIPEESLQPDAEPLLRALGKLDRKLMVLSQKNLNNNPKLRHQYRFLTQALMMQRLARDYLSYAIKKEKTEQKDKISQQASQFDQRFAIVSEGLMDHAHAGHPIRESVAAWEYIASRFAENDDNPVPSLVLRHGNRIVSRLTSVQRMF